MAGTKKRKEPNELTSPPRKKKWSGRMLNSGKKSNSITEANSSTRLLSLPAEIRNRIWGYALCEEMIYVYEYEELSDLDHRRRIRHNGVYICQAAKGDSTVRNNLATQESGSYEQRHATCRPRQVPNTTTLDYASTKRYSPTLLLVCRQVHSEAALMPIVDNTFAFGRNEDMALFAKRLMVVQRKNLRSITLHEFTGCGEEVKMLPGLKNLSIFAEEDMSVLSIPQVRTLIRVQLFCFALLNLDKASVNITPKNYRGGADSAEARAQAEQMSAPCAKMEAMIINRDIETLEEALEEMKAEIEAAGGSF
ncbi:uncharacterized protein LTR77_001798 [Saxophila tyrrhenica]|uniref:DUF7730 domain-containing protein n=1 Tax=Saxophila tyrrhenica TaxID=1690608 RepID=A0AAV9PPL2_9PEZI|nr:hypothetical protein LTR77_001798 [Saxophila tyrrhenica]